ncbi:MAG: TQO small subunit DoxD [Candidatus Limnocylindrales bacterium]
MALGIAPVAALAALRIVTAWNWINGAFFGTDAKMGGYFLSGKFLVARIEGPKGFASTALYPWIGNFIGSGVAHNAALWAWIIFLGEAVAALSLLLGLFTRVGSAAAILSALANLFAAAGNGADTIGQNYLLLMLGIVFFLVGPGRWFGLDGWLQARYPRAEWLRVLG